MPCQLIGTLTMPSPCSSTLPPPGVGATVFGGGEAPCESTLTTGRPGMGIGATDERRGDELVDFWGDDGKYGLTLALGLAAPVPVPGIGILRGSGTEAGACTLLIGPRLPLRGEAVLPPSTCCHFLAPPLGCVGTDAGLSVSPCRAAACVACDVVVAVVATTAAGVNDSLFKSGSSSDFRRRGDPPRPEGEVGWDELGEMCD